MSQSPAPGIIAWADITVPDVEGLKEFYRRVVGWSSSPVDMGGYDDFSMIPPGGEVLAGPTTMGPGSAYAIIRDPVGAVAALYQRGD